METALRAWLHEAVPEKASAPFPDQLLAVVGAVVPAASDDDGLPSDDALATATAAVLQHLELSSIPEDLTTAAPEWAVAQLALYCCVESDAKARHVEILMSLSDDNQAHLMHAIQTVMQLCAPVDGGSEAGSPLPLSPAGTPFSPADVAVNLSLLSGGGRTPVEDKSRKVLERENRLLREEVVEVKTQLGRLTSELDSVRAAASTGFSSSSSGPTNGSRAVDARRTVIQAELEYMKEREEREAEVKEELAGKDAAIAELKAKLGRLEKEATDVEALRDELDVLRPLRAVAAKSEMMAGKYHKQQEALGDLQAQMKELREQSHNLVETNTRLQRDADRLPALKRQVEQYRTIKCDAEVRISELEMNVAGHLADLTTVKSDLAAAREQLRQAQLASTLAAEGMTAGDASGGGSFGLGGGMSEFNPEVMEKITRLEAENALLTEAAAGQTSEAVADLQNQLDDVTRTKIVMEKQWAEEKRAKAEALLRAETAESGWYGEKATAAQVQARLKARMDAAEAGWETVKAQFAQDKTEWEAARQALEADIAALQASNADLSTNVANLTATAAQTAIRHKQEAQRLTDELAAKDRAAAAATGKLETLEGTYQAQLQELMSKLGKEKKRRLEAEAKAEIKQNSWERECHELRAKLKQMKKSLHNGTVMSDENGSMIDRLKTALEDKTAEVAALEKRVKTAEAVAKAKAAAASASSSAGLTGRSTGPLTRRKAAEAAKLRPSSRYGAAGGGGNGEEAYVESMQRLEEAAKKAKESEQTTLLRHADEVRKRNELQADNDRLAAANKKLDAELTRMKLDAMRSGGNVGGTSKNAAGTTTAASGKKTISVKVDSNNPGPAAGTKAMGARDGGGGGGGAAAAADDADSEFSSGPPAALTSNTALLNRATMASSSKLAAARHSVLTSRRRPSLYAKGGMGRKPGAGPAARRPKGGAKELGF